MVAAGSMDGSVSLLSAVSGELLCSRRVHRKYVVSLAWAADGRTFVSASWDASLAVLRVQLSNSAAAGACWNLPAKCFRECCVWPGMRRLSCYMYTHSGDILASSCLLRIDTRHECKPVLSSHILLTTVL